MVKRRVSALLFKHVLREFLIPLICSLAAFAFLFLVNNVFDDLPDFMSKNLGIWKTVVYFLSLQPHNLLHVIPISVLLAASFMTVMLGRNNELCAMRAAGLSLGVCALPVWIIAGIACVCAFFIGESWGPAGLEKASEIKSLIQDPSRKKHDQETISFCNSMEHRDWYCQNRVEGKRLQNVIVRQFDKKDEAAWMISAESAEKKDGRWIFVSGCLQVFQSDGRYQLHEQRGTTAAESTSKRIFSFDEQGGRTLFTVVSKGPLYVGDSMESAGRIYEFVTLSTADTSVLTERPQDLLESGLLSDTVTIHDAMERLHGSVRPPVQAERLLKTVVWNNLTFPLASLVAALFGIAMTIANQRSEIMKGFAGAIGVLVLFYLVGQASLVLGKNGWLPPFVAGALPSLMFLAGGVVLMWRKQ